MTLLESSSGRHRDISSVTLPLLYFSLFELVVWGRQGDWFYWDVWHYMLINFSLRSFHLDWSPYYPALKQNKTLKLFQGSFSFHFCWRWSRAHSWFPERVPQDGDNVTVENGHSLLLDTNTSILSFLHVKGLWSVETGGGITGYNSTTLGEQDGGEHFG